ncbi:hypothetical protein JOE66_001982 [Subtercola frigoramans]|uniref:Uncharacterized protein n=1 Tax=Subtercola frigoramans TaxID=120298 RepID=A0ABS2L5K2_9MICO|nr:hypothetical protein [Subtercola frigoramans]
MTTIDAVSLEGDEWVDGGLEELASLARTHEDRVIIDKKIDRKDIGLPYNAHGKSADRSSAQHRPALLGAQYSDRFISEGRHVTIVVVAGSAP